MEMHAKKKVEIIIETPLLRRVLALVEQEGATGYTVLPSLSGKGHSGAWESGEPWGSLDKVLVLVVTSPERSARLVEQVHALLGDYTGIILVSDVSVVRGDHF